MERPRQDKRGDGDLCAERDDGGGERQGNAGMWPTGRESDEDDDDATLVWSGLVLPGVRRCRWFWTRTPRRSLGVGETEGGAYGRRGLPAVVVALGKFRGS